MSVNVELHLGDCLAVLPTLEAQSIDAVITDPPYGLSFMGKDWDHGVPGERFWAECLRVAKPGAMLLAFGGTRTFHRLTCAIEDAGWEIRDCLMWLYGSGFPKSHDISKAIDKTAGAEREIVGVGKGTGKQNPSWNGTAAGRKENSLKPEYDLTTPATPAAQQWAGWGTALKPAHEIIVRALKPFPDQAERDIIVGNLCQKEAQLWLLLHVSIAGHSLKLSQAELDEVLSIAQWSAEKLTSTRGALCGQMDTSQFVLMTNTCLNIVSSWKNMLADLWSDGNTSTTSTASSPTIDLRTLSYLLSQTTLEDIIQAEMQAPGSQLNVLPAASYLNAVVTSINAIQTLSVLESATYGERTKRLDATADPTPAWEPIILAMKPLDDTFAQNALTHGVAGINVDGCRIATDWNTDPTRRGWQGGNVTTSNNIFGNNGKGRVSQPNAQGRWPANLLLDEEAARLLDEQSGTLTSGASRFFRVFKNDEYCVLCDTSLIAKHGIMNVTPEADVQEDIPCNVNNAEKNLRQNGKALDSVEAHAPEFIQPSSAGKWESLPLLASNVESNLTPTLETNRYSAPSNAKQIAVEQNVRNAKCAENLCDSCVTAIAQSLVAMQQGQTPESLPGLAFIAERKRQILIQGLALFAESRENIDTIPTTASLSMLFGYVLHAIGNCTENPSEKMASEICQTTRFRYQSKASRAERNKGLEGMPERESHKMSGGECIAEGRTAAKGKAMAQNFHPTVKPLELMRYLCRLTKTPFGGVVLDPFMGSGTTGCAALLEGRSFIGIEKDAGYFAIAERRIAEVQLQLPLLELT